MSYRIVYLKRCLGKTSINFVLKGLSCPHSKGVCQKICVYLKELSLLLYLKCGIYPRWCCCFLVLVLKRVCFIKKVISFSVLSATLLSGVQNLLYLHWRSVDRLPKFNHLRLQSLQLCHHLLCFVVKVGGRPRAWRLWGTFALLVRMFRTLVLTSCGIFFALFIFIYGIINFISEALFSNSHIYTIALCSSRKYPYSPHVFKGVLFCTPLPPGNSRVASYLASKILTFKTPLPLWISNDLPWGGHGFYLEMHIKKRMLEVGINMHTKVQNSLNFHIITLTSRHYTDKEDAKLLDHNANYIVICYLKGHWAE